MMPTREIQRDQIVDEDLTRYCGSWVAIRDRKVVAHALDPIELREQAGVREDDLFVLVPSHGTGTYLL
jgi:hypothetical protein